MVTDDNYPPYLFRDASGRPEGYLVDLWALWQRKTGVVVDLRAMQWAAAQRAMHDGDADVIDMIFRTPVRDQLYRFSAPYATQTVGIYVDNDIHGIHGPASLQGFQIGVERGDACADKLGSLGVRGLVAYPSYAAMLAAVKTGAVKVICADDEPLNYYLYQDSQRPQLTRAFTLYTGRFHWAVHRGDAATFALVSRGMTLITPGERAALQRKWFAHPVQFLPYLRIALAVALAAAAALALGAAWIWILRRAVRKRTAQIRESNRQLEAASQERALQHAQLRTLVESSPDMMWLKDRDGRYLDCNARACEVVGHARDDIIGRRDDDLFSDAAFIAIVRGHDREVLRTGQPHRNEETLVSRDGSAHELEVIKAPIRADDGDIVGVLGVARDVSERRLAEREQRIASVAFESQDGMAITDAQGVIQRVNAAFSRISGYAADEVIGQTPRVLKSGRHPASFYAEMWDALAADGYWSGEIVNRRRNGELFDARSSITAVKDEHGRTQHYVGTWQDITAEKQAHAQAAHLKSFDALTDLPNRSLLDDRMAQALARSAERDVFCAVMMIDLDHFQKVNDALGHVVGDRLLIEASRRIQWNLHDGDTVGRFSGDSFVVVVDDLGAQRGVAAVRASDLAEQLRRELDAPYAPAGGAVCTASIGVTLAKGTAASPELLLRQAELALYKSKRDGRNTVRLFEDAMQAEIDQRYRLEAELRDALQRDEFVLHYQVQVDAAGHPLGAEALVRWVHPARGLLGPNAFIPVAEESGLIDPIGRHVLAAACAQLAQWATHDELRELTLAVNVSPRQFKAADFVDDVLAALQRNGADARRLKLEITESLAIDDFEESIGRLHTLRDAGVQISLDDFGTGNSSLKYLTKLPLTQLKIDKSFVDELPDNDSAALVAQTIIAMGRGLALDVIAEGVETREQYAFLAEHGCHAFQGYLFGRPLPLAEFELRCRAAQAAAQDA
ncbi:phytochrome-like protein cph2 [mine drainage metagenome]|uniref:Phytochrome-like protein cph2 n=1 Tax=mine drainage metagenome TaxID=410659 RepID=A0A1J5QS42_9ZZZZ